jgi:hypothetical protein
MDRSEALERLNVLVGEWALEADIPRAPRGRVSFEWALGGQFVLQRTEVPHPQAPDSISILTVDLESGAYQQHYYDSRGVVRLYAMTLEGGVWRLERHAPDFSPLPFHQRFTGAFSEEGNKIEGPWEKSPDGEHWERDFVLTYTRAG